MTRPPHVLDALMVLLADFPEALSDEGRAAGAPTVERRATQADSWTENQKFEREYQARRLLQGQEAAKRAVVAAEEARIRAAAEVEKANRPVMVALHHVDGYVREFDVARAARTVDEMPRLWSYHPWDGRAHRDAA